MTEPDNGKGHYVAVGTSASPADKHYRYHVAWRHGVSERILIQFLGPNAARSIATALNFRHVDKVTGAVTRCWSQLQHAWSQKEITPVEHKIIAPGW